MLLHHHMMRYAFATQFCYNARVVDLGCGTGYGSYVLSMVAKEVWAVDRSMDAIAFGKQHFKADNIVWVRYDIERLSLPEEPDFNVCFEVLEHLDDPQFIIDQYQPLLWSIPIDDGSRFHKRAYSIKEIDELTGGGRWFQLRDGLIVERDETEQLPMYILGITEEG
jgi:SAM-dependent methyltransferase